MQINTAKPQRNSKISYTGETLPDAIMPRLGLSSQFHIPPTLRVAASTVQKPRRVRPGQSRGSGPAGRAVQGPGPLCAEGRTMVTLPPRPCGRWAPFLYLSVASLQRCFSLVPGHSAFLFSPALKRFPQLLPLSGLVWCLAMPPSPGAEAAPSPQDISWVSLETKANRSHC